eukprot:scaffold179822_cov31-Tisochrysis_lutea.AAC.16
MWLALVGASALSLHLPAPRAAARARCATMRFEEYEALEVELRAYLAALEPQDALDAPSPLAYAELTRNGRLDLVEGCMAHGGYIAVSKRMGLPLRFANLIDAPAPQTPRITEELPPTIGLKLSGARREEEMAAAMVKAEASKSGCETRTVEKGGTIYEPTPLNLPSSTKGTAGADSQPSWQFAWLFRFDDAERASLLLFTWVSAVAYGRSSASLLDDGLLTALQIAAQVRMWGLLRALGAVTQPRGASST